MRNNDKDLQWRNVSGLRQLTESVFVTKVRKSNTWKKSTSVRYAANTSLMNMMITPNALFAVGETVQIKMRIPIGGMTTTT